MGEKQLSKDVLIMEILNNLQSTVDLKHLSIALTESTANVLKTEFSIYA